MPRPPRWDVTSHPHPHPHRLVQSPCPFPCISDVQERPTGFERKCAFITPSGVGAGRGRPRESSPPGGPRERSRPSDHCPRALPPRERGRRRKAGGRCAGPAAGAASPCVRTRGLAGASLPAPKPRPQNRCAAAPEAAHTAAAEPRPDAAVSSADDNTAAPGPSCARAPRAKRCYVGHKFDDFSRSPRAERQRPAALRPAAGH